MKEFARKLGYDLEELYFQLLNRELIEKLKQKRTSHLKLVVNNEKNGEQEEERKKRVA